RCLLVRHMRIVKFFVWSDAIIFFLQASGSGLTAALGNTISQLTTSICMIGLSVQLVSFLFFTVVLIVFGWRVSHQFPNIWVPRKPRPCSIFSRDPIDHWRMLFYVICATCVGIIVRSIFRIAEYTGGMFLRVYRRTRKLFYLFDALPLWICMGLYIFVWPVKCSNGRLGQMELPLSNRI
ncbi:hypothetical protein C8J57DRAFT_1072795, partial [Mycena rebaudengoi]